MKRMILFMGIASCIMITANAQQTKTATTPQQVKSATSANPATQPVVAQNPNAAEIIFETNVIDYGEIVYNGDGVRVFKFKNKGKEPLIITRAKGSCGCTVPTWPREPIMPGKSGEISVKYATNRVGPFTKTVTITSNAKTPTTRLTIKGRVGPKPAAEPAPETVPVKKVSVGAVPIEKSK